MYTFTFALCEKYLRLLPSCSMATREPIPVKFPKKHTIHDGARQKICTLRTINLPIFCFYSTCICTHKSHAQHNTQLTSVFFQSHAVLEEVLSGGLGRASQQRPHHDRTSPQRQGLGDVAYVLNTAVCDDGNAKPSCVFRHFVHCRGLRSSHS